MGIRALIRFVGELAWTVERLPSCPVDMALTISTIVSSRISPTIIRSGLIRSAFFTNARTDTDIIPSSADAILASNRLILLRLCFSSQLSSIVTTSSFSGIPSKSIFNNVVFPLPVPPETIVLAFPSTAFIKKYSIFSSRLWNAR